MSKGVLKVGLVIAGVGAMFIPGVNAAVAGLLGVSKATAASLVGVVTSLGTKAATSLIAGSGGKPPPATGSVAQTIIDPNAPQPYVMGEGYVAGVERYRQSWGGTIDKVPNPYLGFVHVYSGGGPADSITPYVDFQSLPPGSWFDGWLLTTTQLGACPEPSALLPTGWTGAPDRDATSKLSGQAAIFWTLRFDKDGKRFTGGIPQTGAYGRWVKVYDPRKDSTRPGGSGSHRIGIESTYEWSENPALHAGTYAFGRYQNGKRVLGIGLPDSAIDWPVVAAWANTCEANSWTIFGRIFEPGDRNQNLSDICAAGGGAPVKAGGVLSFHYWAPRVSLDTVTEADLAEDEASVVAMAPWRERINTIVPKYRGGFDQNWEMVDGAPVSVASYVTEDGEEKKSAWPWNLVKSINQAAQLSSYKIQDMRELQPIVITCGPRMRAYRPGECLQLNIPRLGLNTKAVIMKRRRDPARNTVTFTLMGETDGKHAFALGQTTTPPPTPALAQTGQARDTLFDTVFETSRITGKLTTGGALPAAAASGIGDTHIGDDGTIYTRVNDGGVLLGGFAVTLGGYRPQLAWTLAASQPLRDTIAEAGLAYADSNEALDDLADLANDGVLSINEKNTKLIPDSLRLEDKWSALYALATSLGVSTTDAGAARSAWLAYLASLSPAWNDVRADTLVSRTAYNSARDGYDAALYELDRAIKGSAATTATWAGVSGGGKPEDSADVTSAIDGLSLVEINADYTGAVTATLPRAVGYKLIRNGVDVTTSATWSVAVVSGTIGATIGAATGILALDLSSGSLTDAVLAITAVYGTTTRQMTVKVAKVLAAAPNTGGGGSGAGGSATGSINGSSPNNTMTAVGPELTVTTGSGGAVGLYATYNFDTATGNSNSISLATQWYRWNGSAYVALGSEVAATTPYSSFPGEPGEPGYGECSFNATGLGSGSTEKFRLYARNTGTFTFTARQVYGDCSAVAS